MIEKSIFLIGMMGSGKTTVGVRLAEALGLPFFDTDALIESAAGRSVQQIFEQDGEAYFRAQERQLIANWPEEVGVVACGGGLPCFFDHLALLKEKGTVIYLEAMPALLYERIKGEATRPKLTNYNSFEQLLADREVVYNKAHFKVDAKQSVEEIIAEVLPLRAAITNQ